MSVFGHFVPHIRVIEVKFCHIVYFWVFEHKIVKQYLLSKLCPLMLKIGEKSVIFSTRPRNSKITTTKFYKKIKKYHKKYILKLYAVLRSQLYSLDHNQHLNNFWRENSNIIDIKNCFHRC